MKAKKYDWLLKLSYVTDDGDYRASYVNVLGLTKEEVTCIVDKYRKNLVVVPVKNLVAVYVYKLQKI